MLKSLRFLTLVVLFIGTQVLAQSTKKALPVFKYGKIDLKEFETKISGQDSAADAIKLFDVGTGYFEVSGSTGSFVYVFERHVRYKIINKNAYDLADLEIALYRNRTGSEQKLQFVNGATYNLNNGKIEVSKIGSDAKFSTRLDKNYTVKKFTLPNVKEGSIIEFSYKTKSDFIFSLDEWYFQSSYPCLFSAFTLTIPGYYQYKTNAGGYVQINHPQPVEITQTFHIPSTSTSNAGSVNSNASKSVYYAENIPAIKTENYITTLDDYISKIGFELNSSHFPSEGYKEYTSTWPKCINEMIEHEKFGGFINRNNIGKEVLSGIIKTETDPQKIMKLIFDYVKNTIKWDGKYSDLTVATNPRAVMEKKSGNSAEINLCLYTLLNNAGLSSFPVLLSTRNNGAHPGYPMLGKFNNVIVRVEIIGKNFLLDATDKNNTSDLISYQNLNHQGLKVRLFDKDAEWIPIESDALSRNTIYYHLTMDTDNKFKGQLYLSSNNYSALSRRNAYQGAANEQEYLKNFKSDKPGLEISNYKINNLGLPEEALEESMDVTIEDNVEDAGNLAYFMPLLFDRTKDNPFNLEERNFPVDFAYPTEETYRITLDFPAAFKLDKLPKSEKFTLPDNAGSFTMLYNTEENKLAIISKINLTKSTYTAEEYYNLKELFKNIVRKQAEQVVFKKS